MTDETRVPVVVAVADPDLADDCREWLDDCDVRTTTDWNAALQVVDGSVAVVLLDRALGGPDAEAKLRALRNRQPGVQVALLADDDPGFSAIEAGFEATITKPASAAAVRETVADLRTRRDHARQLEGVRERVTDAVVDEEPDGPPEVAADRVPTAGGADTDVGADVDADADGTRDEGDEPTGRDLPVSDDELVDDETFVGTVRAAVGADEAVGDAGDGPGGTDDATERDDREEDDG